MCLIVFVFGYVQGVGYWFFVQWYVCDLGFYGYVENFSDGKVEVIVEGDEDVLNWLLYWLWCGLFYVCVQVVDMQYSEEMGLWEFYIY